MSFNLDPFIHVELDITVYFENRPSCCEKNSLMVTGHENSETLEKLKIGKLTFSDKVLFRWHAPDKVFSAELHSVGLVRIDFDLVACGMNISYIYNRWIIITMQVRGPIENFREIILHILRFYMSTYCFCINLFFDSENFQFLYSEYFL